jgi:hypothetical protein
LFLYFLKNHFKKTIVFLKASNAETHSNQRFQPVAAAAAAVQPPPRFTEFPRQDPRQQPLETVAGFQLDSRDSRQRGQAAPPGAPSAARGGVAFGAVAAAAPGPNGQRCVDKVMMQPYLDLS